MDRERLRKDCGGRGPWRRWVRGGECGGAPLAKAGTQLTHGARAEPQLPGDGGWGVLLLQESQNAFTQAQGQRCWHTGHSLNKNGDVQYPLV